MLDKPITFGSGCSGIEAATEATRDLGWVPSWFTEIEEGPAQILRQRHPDTDNLGDFMQLPALVSTGLVPAPEVFVAGTPCQAFSLAGTRGSLSDERGGLTLAFVETANAIDEERQEMGYEPAVHWWENVPGVLTTKDNAFGYLLSGLAGDSEPLEPGPRPEQGRASVHWTWKKDTGEHVPKWPESGFVVGPRRAVAWRVLDAQHFGLAQRRKRVFVVASASERFRCDAVLFEYEGVRRDNAPVRREGTEFAEVGLCPTDCWWDGSDVSQTLDAVLYKKQCLPEKNRFPAVIQDGKLRYITPVEAERLMGFRDNYTLVQMPNGKMASDSTRYKALGNSMPVSVMRWIAERITSQLRSTP